MERAHDGMGPLVRAKDQKIRVFDEVVAGAGRRL
jgi:hypothetical protein